MDARKPEEDNNRISNIAHFFLSDMKAEKSDGGNGSQNKIRNAHTVKRNKPTNHPYPPPPQRTDQSEMTDPSCFLNCHLNKSESKAEFIGVVCSHLKWQSMGSVRQFAKALAKTGKKVGLLNLQSWSAQFNLYHQNKPNENIKPDTAKDEYFEEPIETLHSQKSKEQVNDIIGQLDERIDSLDYLLLVYGPEFNNYSHQLLSALDRLCVITNPERESLIGAYQTIKHIASQNGDIPIGVFVSDVDTESRADEVYQRLANTAKQHAGLELSYFGCFVAETPLVAEMIARQQIRSDSQQSIEQWIENLQQWIEEHKSKDEPKLKEANMNEQEIDNNEQIESHSVNGNRIIKISTLTGDDQQFIALHIGKHLLSDDYKPSSSDLIDFLRASNVFCARFSSEHNSDSYLVIVYLHDQDRTIIDWLTQNYPHKTDKLIVASDAPLGTMETQTWRKQFADVRIIPMLAGLLDGEEVIMLSGWCG